MKAKKDATKVRNRYSPEFKKQALERVEKDGVTATARDLSLNEGQLYAWRQKQRLEELTGEDQKLQQGELTRLKRDLARLEEENAFLKKAAAYFAKLPK
jgi:transposase